MACQQKRAAITGVDDEFKALTQTAGILDFSDRSRLCLLGEDRARFLNGQVTNDINSLSENTGCYAALINAKGKMESDLFIYKLADEILLDFEPGLTQAVKERLENYIITEDVEIVDAAPHFGLLSVQGPESEKALKELGLTQPENKLNVAKEPGGEYVINQPRLGTSGFDLFITVDELENWKGQLVQHAQRCCEDSFEKARILATIPRFGQDLTGSNLPPEGGLESRAISYAKGCYIGQEIIARLRTFGQITMALRGLKLKGPAAVGDAVVFEDKEVGILTSVTSNPDSALAILKRTAYEPDTCLYVDTKNGRITAQVATLPFEIFTF